MSSHRTVKSRLAAVLVDNPKYVEYCALTMLVFVAVVASASVIITRLQGAYLASVTSAFAPR